MALPGLIRTTQQTEAASTDDAAYRPAVPAYGYGGAWVWDATSGLPVGFTIVTLPGSEIAVFDAIAGQLVRAPPPLHSAVRSAESA